MKPAAFDYRAARTPEEAVELLAGSEGDARVLAGGQSLVLDMNLRRTRPDRLVDINPSDGLDGLTVDGGTLRIGALVRHRAFEDSTVPGPLGGLLSMASRHIAHPPVRARGTMAGSLAYAHPAAEWGAVAAALGAEIELLGPSRSRTVPAADFVHGPFTTDRRPDELITEVRLPLLDDDTGVGFAEQRRTHASFAMAAAVVTLTVRDDTIADARIGLANAADRPLRTPPAEQALIGEMATGEAFAAAGDLAARSCDPRPEPYCSPAYRRDVVTVLVRRALEQAATSHRGGRST